MPEITPADALYVAEVGAQNAQRLAQNLQPLDPNDDVVLNDYRERQRNRHRNTFPLIDNLFTLIFIVLSDLTETQRERLQSTMALQGLQVRRVAQ